MLREQSRRDALAVYAGYWNAFELLVSAANLIIPRRKLSPADKANIIRTDLLKAGANIGAPHIETLYRKVVDPGLRAEAEHALRTCMPDQADHFLIQCFKYQPSRQGLYRIRNAINHGTVDVDDPEMEMMVSARFPELWRLVFSMLGGLVSVNLTQKTNSQ